jgi:two-component system sensor histidine kinase HydH
MFARSESSYYHTILYSSVVLLLLFSVIATISTFGTYRISIKGSRHLLETRALDMAVNIGFTIESVGVDNGLFHKLAMQDKWEELAFISLFDREGRIIMHSNPLLVGDVKGDSYVKDVIEGEKVVFHDFVLGTGEDVFVLDFPLKLRLRNESGDSEKEHSPAGRVLEIFQKASITQAPEPHTYCLRVALHTYPARFIVRQANFQLTLIAVSLVALWVLAFFVINTWRRNMKLEERLAEQERMAVLGRMSAVLAHEIRNPLASIKGFAQIYSEDNNDPELVSDMKIIEAETERLEHLTTNLLIYAKPVRLERREFDLQDYCGELKRYLKSDHENVRLEISCGEGQVFQDRDRLTQVIRNLVQNGINASAEAGGDRVRLEIEKRDGQFHVIVKDSGPGVPDDIRDKLFEPFFTTRTRGTGLGLAIVKRIVTLMDGKTEVMDNPDGRGAMFHVSMPDMGMEQERAAMDE